MQHVRMGEQVPYADPPLATGPSRPNAQAVELAPDGPNHRTAVLHFEAAARCDPICAAALLARAAATPDARARYRMLLGVFQVRNQNLARSERSEALLLALMEAREPVWVRSTATEMLGDIACATRSPRAIDRFVVSVLERWPVDPGDLAEPHPALGCCMRCPTKEARLRTHADIRGLIRTAAATGDARIVERLLKREKPNPGPDYVRYVLDCLQLAAPHVDEPTARRLHDLFVLRPENLGPIGAQLTETQRAVLVLIGKLHPRLPEDLLPSVEPLFANEASNAVLRRFTKSRLR